MKRYYAKQAEPELAEDLLFYNHGREIEFNDEGYENETIIHGNRNFISITTKAYDDLTRLDNIYYEIETGDKHYWNCISDFLNAYFPKENKKKYNTREVAKWKALFKKYESNWKIEDIVCDALELMTDKKWKKTTLRGCSQSDWQYCYYSQNISDEMLHYLEISYFNTGSLYRVYESLEDMENDGDCCDMYVDSYRSKEILAEQLGCSIDELEVYDFDHYSRTPHWKMV